LLYFGNNGISKNSEKVKSFKDANNLKGLIMLNKIILILLTITALVFSGCGSDGDGESKMQTQQMLDEGNYDGVINKLEANADNNSQYLSLAAAYMGKAGFSLSSIISIVTTSSESTNNDAFATFIETSAKLSDSNSLENLDLAVKNFKKVIHDKCLTPNITLSSSEQDLCLYIGLSKIAKTAVTIGYITDKIDTFRTDAESDNKLAASLCAIQYAIDPSSLNSKCSVTNEDNNVTFTTTNRTYQEPTFIVNGESFENLITYTTPRSTVLTNGICTKDDFSTRIKDKNDTKYDNSLTYHPCPVAQSDLSDEITTQSILVDALNDGSDFVDVAVSDDVKEDIDKFKNDVLKANNRENDTDKTITLDDILKYLEDNNK